VHPSPRLPLPSNPFRPGWSQHVPLLVFPPSFSCMHSSSLSGRTFFKFPWPKTSLSCRPFCLLTFGGQNSYPWLEGQISDKPFHFFGPLFPHPHFFLQNNSVARPFLRLPFRRGLTSLRPNNCLFSATRDPRFLSVFFSVRPPSTPLFCPLVFLPRGDCAFSFFSQLFVATVLRGTVSPQSPFFVAPPSRALVCLQFFYPAFSFAPPRAHFFSLSSSFPLLLLRGRVHAESVSVPPFFDDVALRRTPVTRLSFPA